MTSYGFLPRMRGREREMSTRVPVLGEYHVLEPRGEAVDQRHHVFAVWNREASAEAEIILNVHHQQDIPVADLYLLIHQRDPSCIASRLSTSPASRSSVSATATG